MSHFTKVNGAGITDPQAFFQACFDLGIDGERAENTMVRGWRGRTVWANHVLKRSNGYDIGLIRNDHGKLEIVADFMGCSVPGNVIMQHALKNQIAARYKRLGFRVAVETDENKNLVVNLTR